MNKQNIIFASIIALMLAVIAYLIWQNNDLKKMQIKYLSGRDAGSGRQGKTTDPYIAGPVKNTIVKRSGEIQECYKVFLAKGLKGKTDGAVKVDFSIDTDGKALNPEVVFSELNDKDFGKCVTSRISAWRFPEPDMQKYVAHTFTFKKK